MGYILEPDGVDFIIQSKPLTKKEKEKFIAFIEERKRLNKIKSSMPTKKRTSRKTKEKA
ncbi:MAG: hypothetical protein ACK5UE_04310 [Chitinophagales bacterium]|jgi:hypothetical protein|nr:hypothetical protein [Sphingobacteriales bacterium]